MEMNGQNSRRGALQSKSITLSGLLVPDKWDDKGTITGLALLTKDEEKYLIKPDNNLGPLLPALRRTISLEGVVKMDKGKKLLFYHSPPAAIGD